MAGHSFANSLVLSPSGGFLAMDLGDNYPRGVHLHRFPFAPGDDDESRQGRVVYEFKTAHGKSPTSPAGVEYERYDGISTYVVLVATGGVVCNSEG